MKIRGRNLTKKERMETLDALYTAASSIRGRDSVKMFLKDLLTESERIMLGRRVLIARKLLAGNTYENIEDTMRVGSDTIRRVERWLNDQLPGYEQAIKGLEKEFSARELSHKRRKSLHPLAVLKRKYPLHFLLFPWPKNL
jgi:uncharacterized protein YerC